MDVVRQIYESLPETLEMPDSLKNRPVEVILLPLDEAPVKPDKKQKNKKFLMRSLEHGREKPSLGRNRASTRTENRLNDPDARYQRVD